MLATQRVVVSKADKEVKAVVKVEAETEEEVEITEVAVAVVDVEQELIAINGELHADEEALLLEHGARQTDLWGINLYPDRPHAELIEFDSMINVRPSQGNRSRGVDDPAVQRRIQAIVTKLVVP